MRRAILLALGAALLAAAPAAASSPPQVVSVVRGGPEHNKDSYQQWVIHFDQGVYGLDAGNIQVKRYPDGFGGPIDVNFANGNSFVGVGVGTPSGTGTVAVHLINVGNIKNIDDVHMVAGDTGEEQAYYVDRTGPHVQVFHDGVQGDTTADSPVRFRLAIDEAPILGLTPASILLGGTAGATTAAIGPADFELDRTLSVSGMTGPGTVSVDLPAGAFTDELGNPSEAASGIEKTVTYTGAGTPSTTTPSATVPVLPGLPAAPSGPSPAPPPGPPSTTSAGSAPPKLTLGKVGALTLSSKGLVVPVTCTPQSGRCRAAVVVKAKRTTLCRATKSIPAGKRTMLAAACSKAGAARIKRAGRHGLAVSIAVTVTDGAGRHATQVKTGKATAPRHH
jgi:hypothetical protein